MKDELLEGTGPGELSSLTMTAPHEKQRLAELITTEWPKLERFFRSKVVASDAQDLAQEVMLGFVQRGVPIAEGRAFFWGIARNKLADYWRHKHAAKRKGQMSGFDSTIHSINEFGPTLSSVINRKNRILGALQTLPADHHIAIELKLGEGLTDQEGAEALDVSLSTYKRYVGAGVEKLREQFGVAEANVGPAYRGE